jgi:hypothetical protein
MLLVLLCHSSHVRAIMMGMGSDNSEKCPE